MAEDTKPGTSGPSEESPSGEFSSTVLEIPASGQPFQHCGERFILVLSGEIRLSNGETNLTMCEGETIHYEGHREHTISSTTETPASILIVTSPEK